MAEITIVWLRHGEKAYANSKGPLGSFAHDPPLKPGAEVAVLEQGRALVKAYGLPLYCLTSPYLRTRETAKHLLAATGGAASPGESKRPQQYVDVDIGEFLGNQKPYMGADGVMKFVPNVGADTASYASRTGALPPIGERLSDLAARCRKHLRLFHLTKFSKAAKASDAGFTIWVVTHGLVLRNIYTALVACASNCGLSFDAMPTVSGVIRWDPPSLGGFVLRGQYGMGANVSLLSPPVEPPQLPVKASPLPGLPLPGETVTEAKMVRPEAHATLLDEMYAHWTLTQAILDALKAHLAATFRGPRMIRTRAHMLYEGSNIIERWLLTAANAANGELYAPPDTAPGTGILRIQAPFNVKFAQELMDKGIVKALPEATTFVTSVLEMVAASRPVTTGFTPTCDGKEITYGPKFRTPLTPRLKNLVAISSCADVTAIVLFYAATIQGGQHWGLTQEHADMLYYDFNVRNEGFASPPNSRYAGKYKAFFNSLSPKTDAVVGSKGSFFDTDMMASEGNWTLNPFFVDAAMVRAQKKEAAFLKAAAEAKQERLVFCLEPAWVTSEAIIALTDSPHLVASVKLRRGHYHFELPDSTRIVASIDCMYFCHSSLPLSTSERGRIETMMLSLNSATPLTK